MRYEDFLREANTPGRPAPLTGRRRKFIWNRSHGRCGHAYCADCKTKRGRNRGNRNIRHAVRLALRKPILD